MSKRRKIGERVWVVEGAGFNASRGEWATIIDWPTNTPDQMFPCCLSCGDDDCVEFGDVQPDRPDVMLYHVSECEMFDEPQVEAAPVAEGGERPADTKPTEPEGPWAADDLRRAVVEGAKWWEYKQHNATMWNSDIRLAEEAAERLYPGGRPSEELVRSVTRKGIE